MIEKLAEVIETTCSCQKQLSFSCCLIKMCAVYFSKNATGFQYKSNLLNPLNVFTRPFTETSFRRCCKHLIAGHWGRTWSREYS